MLGCEKQATQPTTLETLAECKEVYGVKVYVFCLMTNHFHLILRPAATVYPWLDVDPCFVTLGAGEAERRTRYRDFVFSTLAEEVGLDPPRSPERSAHPQEPVCR